MKKYFIAGLIILLPLVITYWIFKFVINFITAPFEKFVTDILSHYELFETGTAFFSREDLIIIFTKLLILVTLVVSLVFIGLVARWFIFRILFQTMDTVLHKIPFINKIYLSCKDFTTAIFSPKAGSFSQVVLVPFPSTQQLAIGLITSELTTELIDSNHNEYLSVLIPGTPNPTIGFILFFKREDTIPIPIAVDEALKYVMSCGSVLPAKFSRDKSLSSLKLSS